MRLPLPLVEVWEELQAEVERLTGEARLQILQAILEDEVQQVVEPRHRPDPSTGNQRWGRQPGCVVFAGQKIALVRPRVRSRVGGEVELTCYRRLQQDGRMQRAVAERIVSGLSTRRYRRAVEAVLEGYGIEHSSVSRHFVRATAQQLQQLCERWLEELRLVALVNRRYRSGRANAGGGAGCGRRRYQTRAGAVAGRDGEHDGGESAAGRPGRARLRRAG